MKIKKSRKKAVLVQVIGSYALTLISIIQGLILIPMYFKYIGIEQYGYWVTLISFATLIATINYGFGRVIIQNMSRLYSNNNISLMLSYYFNGMVFYVFMGTLYLLISFFLLVFFYSGIIIKNYNLVCFLLFFSVFFTFVNEMFYSFFQAILEPKYNVYIKLVGRVIGLFVLVVMLFSGYEVIALAFSLLLSEVVICFLCFLYRRKVITRLDFSHNKARFDNEIWKELFMSFPSMSKLKLGDNLLVNTTPILLTTYVGAEITAIYNVFTKVSNILFRLLNSFNASLISPLANALESKSLSKVNIIIRDVLTISFSIILLMYLYYSFININVLEFWLDDYFEQYSELVYFIGFSMVIFSFTTVLRNLTMSLGFFTYTANFVFIQGLLFVMFSLVLFLFFKSAFVISIALSLSSFICILFLIKKISFERIYYTKMLFITCFSFIVFYVSSLLFEGFDEPLSSLFIKFVFMSFIVFFFSLIFYKNELKRFYTEYLSK